MRTTTTTKDSAQNLTTTETKFLAKWRDATPAARCALLALMRALAGQEVAS